MIIESSSLAMTGMSVSVSHHEVKESMQAWVGDRRPSGAARAGQVHGAHETRRAEFATKPELEMLTRLIERLSGKKLNIRWLTEDDLKPNYGKPQGYGFAYDRQERHYEAEQMRFQANGIVRTADGKEIDFAIDLGMSRQFYSEQRISLRAGDALKDPLVMNFSGTAAQLTQTRFQFDIDVDGQADSIPFSANGGLLALDKNGDGRVNDGSELFGAISGDGFADLAAYDSDGNQWIDANDPVFSQLRLWTKDANGQDRLVGLAELGVGAIHVNSVATPFSVKDGDNALLGQVRESGVYLMEDGTPGVIQKIDLSV
jgi:hypothetical protein